MKLKICHFSDWHGMWLDLPVADLYLCTGDMLPNSRGHSVDWLYEERFQKKFIQDNPITIPAGKSVYMVRGNHDHVDLYDLFQVSEGGEKFEFVKGNTQTWHAANGQPLNLTGCRGVKKIRGYGPDEKSLEELEKSWPNPYNMEVDIILTHSPPYEILDKLAPWEMREGEDPHSGSPYLRQCIEDDQPLLHCFGHVHVQKGVRRVGETICSNAATGINIIEVDLAE